MTKYLRDLHDLLMKYNAPQAGVIASIVASEEGSDQFKELLSSTSMWGGAGAVWEVDLAANPGAHSRDEAQRDERRFREALIGLVDEMERAGISIPRAREVANVFKKWSA